jgi:hypothetical protein
MTKTATKSMAPISRTSAGLRDALFDELDRLRNGETNATNANATARLATGIVDIVSMEIEVQKFAERHVPDSVATGSGMPKALPLGA